jgi:dipeptidyl aminopeptidase/acylaminoacyl peptidase
MERPPRIGRSGLGWILVLSACVAARAEEVSPSSGVGYPHRTIRIQDLGSGPRSYYLFEPARPAPKSAPVVVFLHGWYAYNPAAYGGWIAHLVRSGRIVIFPRYQASTISLPANYLDHALAAVRDALDVLETAPEHVRPDRKRFALIGHSMGASLAAQLAAVAGEVG